MQRLQPHKITKPIQLLASWLVGLVAVNGSFLYVAAMETGSWERSALVVAAILNVPLFLLAMFVLQTKFRPELQEDEFYSQYLDKKRNMLVSVTRDTLFDKELSAVRAELREIATLMAAQAGQDDIGASIVEPELVALQLKVGVNDYLDNFKQTLALLKSQGIEVTDLFGSQYSDEGPIGRVLSIGEHVPFADKKKFLRIASDAGFDGYRYFRPWEEDTEEDVLFGSYGGAMFPVNHELASLMAGDSAAIDLKVFENQHGKVAS